VHPMTWLNATFARLLKCILTQNICAPELRHSKRGREDGEVKMRGQHASCCVTSPLSQCLGPLAMNVCICNGQRSSEIPCDKYRPLV
jgi:hypothetical protein